MTAHDLLEYADKCIQLGKEQARRHAMEYNLRYRKDGPQLDTSDTNLNWERYVNWQEVGSLYQAYAIMRLVEAIEKK